MPIACLRYCLLCSGIHWHADVWRSFVYQFWQDIRDIVIKIKIKIDECKSPGVSNVTELRCSHRHHVFNSATSEWYNIICQATLSWLPFVNFERALGTDNRKKEWYLPISLAQTYTRRLRTQEVNRLSIIKCAFF